MSVVDVYPLPTRLLALSTYVAPSRAQVQAVQSPCCLGRRHAPNLGAPWAWTFSHYIPLLAFCFELPSLLFTR